MLTRNQFLAIVREECEIAKHLHSKLSPESLDYRLSPGQRSTLELMRYLSMCGIAGTRGLVESNWDFYGALNEEADRMTSDGFPGAMDRQAAAIEQAVAGLTEQDFLEREATYVSGAKMPLGQALVMGPLRWLTAYRMQLFLQAKASGASELATANVWSGKDPQKK